MFFDILVEWIEDNPQDPLAVAREWQEMGQGSAAEQFARRLRKDLTNYYRGTADQQNTMAVLIRSGLRRVNFRQIAEQLLRLCQPAEARREAEDDESAAA